MFQGYVEGIREGGKRRRGIYLRLILVLCWKEEIQDVDK
jgi:hypothetical protein